MEARTLGLILTETKRFTAWTQQQVIKERLGPHQHDGYFDDAGAWVDYDYDT